MDLGAKKLVTFVAITNAERAKAFYRDTLGLKLASDELPFALVFDCHGSILRATMVREVAAAQYTVLGWEVDDIVASVKGLVERGVQFERFPGLPLDEHGIWSAPGGAKVAWFKDPDGNILSLSKH